MVAVTLVLELMKDMGACVVIRYKYWNGASRERPEGAERDVACWKREMG